MAINHSVSSDNTFTPQGKVAWDASHSINLGTASAPALAPSAALSTGIYFTSSKILGSINGVRASELNTDSVYIGSGNVGAGGSITSATRNVMIGENAGRLVTSGGSNVIIGYRASLNTSSAIFANVIIGDGAGAVLQNGDLVTSGGFQEVLVGELAGASLTTGPNNTLVGNQAGKLTTTGGSNAMFGRAAGNSNVNGGFNTYVGHAAGFRYTSANENTFIGDEAGNPDIGGDPDRTGSDNIAIGRESGTVTAAGANTICIGNGTTVTGSNATKLGNASTSTCAIMGITTLNQKLYPATDGAATQAVCALYAGNGAPNNSNGADGDFYFRGDGTAAGNTVIYHRQAGSWVALVTT